MEEKKIKLNLFIYSQQAESGPPLGTILGNLGVNTIKFCKDFNEFTQDLPFYFKLYVDILIEENKSFTYKCKISSLGHIISLLKVNEEYILFDGTYTFECIDIDDLYQLCKFKYPFFK